MACPAMMGEALALLSGFFYGYSNTFTFRGLFRIGFRRITTATLIVNSTMSLLATAVFFAAGALPPVNLRGLLYFAIAGFLATFLGRAFLFAAFGYIGASRGSLIRATSPLITIFVAWVALGERLGVIDVLGAMAVLAGIVFLTKESLPTRLPGSAPTGYAQGPFPAGDGISSNAGTPISAVAGILPHTVAPARPVLGRKVLGVLMAIGAAVCFGVGDVFRKAGMMSIPSPWLGSSVGLCIGLVCSWLYCCRSSPQEGPRLSDVTQKHVFMSGLLTGLALFSFFISINHVPVAIGSVLCGTEPMFTLLTSYLVFGKAERITYRVGLGALFVLGGVAAVVLY